jgi:hypothetical protein
MANQVYSRSALRSGVSVQAGQSTTFTVKALVTVAEYDADGGPASPCYDSNGNLKSPTESGEYVIVGTWKHVSKGQWAYSMIEWGSPLREQNGILEVFAGGTWQPLKKYVQNSKQELSAYYNSMYGKNELPKTWVFNDFGHITCFIAKDLDHDGIWDKNTEKIHHQFFHTTPPDEALTALNKSHEIKLLPSHGCIHVKPKDIDEMIAKGYMKKGNMVYIHDYATKPLGPTGLESGQTPYSLHFFPGIKKLFIKGQK